MCFSWSPAFCFQTLRDPTLPGSRNLAVPQAEMLRLQAAFKQQQHRSGSILLLQRMWYSCLTTNASLSLFCYWNCLLYKLEMFASKTIFKRIRFSEQKWLNETRKYLRGKKHETASDNVWLQSIKESFHVFTKRKRKEKSFYPLKKYTDKKFRIHLHFGMLPNTELFLLPWFLLNIPFLFASLKQWHLTVCISIFGWGKKSVLVLLGSNYHSWIMFLFFKSNKCL